MVWVHDGYAEFTCIGCKKNSKIPYRRTDYADCTPPNEWVKIKVVAKSLLGDLHLSEYLCCSNECAYDLQRKLVTND